MSPAGGRCVSYTWSGCSNVSSMCPPTAAAVALDGAKEDYGYLQRLWSFLRRSSLELRNVTHLCHWVSVLFGEQDDDMVEAAKALLSIFQHHR